MHRPIRIFVSVVLTVTLAAVLGVPWAGVDAQTSSRRLGEVIVVPGSELARFVGASAGQLWVWTWHDRWTLHPSQMDERDGSGNYVNTEDGVLDANDEVVFIRTTDGLEAPDGQWPPGIERDHPWAHVVITDPVDDNMTTHMYVFRSRTGPEIALEPYLTFDAATKEVRTDQYTLGMADPDLDGYVGLKRLSLFRSTTDLLDRMKVRVVVTVFGSEQEVTEESLTLLGQLGVGIGGLTPDPVIVGPVRAVFDAAGDMIANPWTVDVSLDGLGDVGGGGFIELGAMRISLDLSAEAVPATYADAGNTEPVPVDGVPDEVVRSPLPRWREMSFADGRVVLVSHAEDGAAAELYYKDDEAADRNDTGDGKSYGDNGVSGDSVDEFVAAGFPGRMFVVPADWPFTPNELLEGIDNPLRVEVTYGAEPPTPTAGGPTLTPYPASATPSESPIPTAGGPTLSPSPSAPPTDVPGGHAPAYLPVAFRGQ